MMKTKKLLFVPFGGVAVALTLVTGAIYAVEGRRLAALVPAV